jgi:hypothetical protein
LNTEAAEIVKAWQYWRLTMKLFQIGLSILAASTVFSASAQTIVIPRHSGHRSLMAGVNQRGIAGVQEDLIAAIKSMESALPIYDGDRVKSIRFAHRGLAMIDRALYGAKASLRPQSKARDQVSSKSAHSQYSSAQIQASQTAMEQGYQALSAAYDALRTAVNNNPGKKGVELANLIEQSGSEAKTAMAIHGGAPSQVG